MTAKLDGRVALITGANAGIGEACARLLAQAGAQIVLTRRRRELLDQLIQEAEKLGVKAISAIGDAQESTAIKNARSGRCSRRCLLACRQSPRSRIIEIHMRTMAESLA